MSKPCSIAVITLLTLLNQAVRADLVIFDTLPPNGSLSVSADTGQTFATPANLGVDVRLDNIVIAGPISTNGNFTYALQFFEDDDQDAATWGLGTILGETPAQTIGIGQQGTFDFDPFNIILDPNTVYGFRFTDGAGAAIDVRIGSQLNNTATGASTGFLFNGGSSLANLDAAARINSVPEPAMGLLIVFVSLGVPVWLWQRKRLIRQA